jgi:hypothetical protein
VTGLPQDCALWLVGCHTAFICSCSRAVYIGTMQACKIRSRSAFSGRCRRAVDCVQGRITCGFIRKLQRLDLAFRKHLERFVSGVRAFHLRWIHTVTRELGLRGSSLP